MSARIVSLSILLAVWLVSAPAAGAEEPGPSEQAAARSQVPPPPPTVEDLAKQLDQLQQQLSLVQAQMKTLSDAVQAFQRPSASPQGETAQKGLVPVDRVTRAEFDALARVVYEQEGALGDIATRVGQAGANRYVVNLRGLMQIPRFQQDLAEAVHEVIRQQGTLKVENRSDVEHRLLVNGTAYRIPAWQTVAIEVPVGTVATELLGYERPKHWTVGPPDYEQGITITPTASPAVYVSPPAVVEEPIFYSPPVVLY